MDTNGLILITCPYELQDGRKCNSDKIIARGYCEKHYRTLRRAGAFADLVSKPRKPNEVVIANVRSVRRARRKLLKNIPDYVDLHLTAARIAAQAGDSKPSQWAMEHTRVVDSIRTSNEGTAHHTLAPVINIGVKISGVSDNTDRDKS